MTLVLHIVGDLFLLIGAFFCFLGALGLIRMPDVYNRIQASTKAVTLGTLSILIGAFFWHLGWWPKLLAIAVLLLLTNPVGSSTIARALFHAGVRPWHVRDDSSQNDERGG
jgi:multicomponent Na+:H+ antiporter subunit G